MLLRRGTQRTSLRSTLLACVPQSFVYHTAAKILVYQTDHSAVLYRTTQNFYESAVVHCIEETFKVEVNYILVAFTDRLPHFSQCVQVPSSRTEAKTTLRELRLIDDGQYLVDGLLYHSEWNFHDVVFGHPHESLHSPIERQFMAITIAMYPFGFRPISLGAVISKG